MSTQSEWCFICAAQIWGNSCGHLPYTRPSSHTSIMSRICWSSQVNA